MLDEMTSLNASIFAKFLEYKVKNLVGVCDFSYSKNMANIEAFSEVISSSIHLLFQKWAKHNKDIFSTKGMTKT